MNNRSARRRARQRRNVLMTVALMLVVALVSVGGTIAWLQDSTSEVKNTFSPSNIELTLVETKTDFKMVPGSPIDKDPKVTVDNDVDAWVFVKITESTAPDLDDYISYAVADDWTLLETACQDTNNDNTNDVLVYYRSVGAGDTTKAFSVIKGDKVTVLTTVTEDMMDAITGKKTDSATSEDKDKPTLTFQAYAIQKANITATDTKTVEQVAWETASGTN